MIRRLSLGLNLGNPTIARYLIAVALVGFAVDGGVYAVLLNLFLVRLGLGPQELGLVNAAGTLVFALASVPSGIVGERIGSRPAMLLGLGLMLAGALLLPLADRLPTASQIPWLLAQMGVLYLGLALFFVNTAPFVLAVVDGDQRTQLLSLQTALLSLAAFGGSLVGGLLPPLVATLSGSTLAETGPFGVALMTGGLAMGAAVLALRGARAAGGPPPPAPLAPAGAPTVVAPIVGLIALIALVRMLQVAGIAAASTFFNVYLDTTLAVPTAQIGVIIAVSRLLGVPAALTTTALTRRFGKRGVVIGATLGTAVGLLPIALIPHWAAAGLGFVTVIGLSWVRYAASLVYFLELVPPNRRALVSGVTEMAAGICFTALAFGGGIIVDVFDYRTLFLVGAGVTTLSAAIFWLAFRHREPLAEPAAQG